MKLSSIFLTLIFCTFTAARIFVTFDDDDLDRIVDFFETIHINNNNNNNNHIYNLPTPPNRCRIGRHIKKIVGGLMQLAGIMVTLVGATYISTRLDASPAHTVMAPPTASVAPEIMHINDTCNAYYGYGCHKEHKICWRACTVKNKDFWCYTAPDPTVQRLKYCKRNEDCLPCWECGEGCYA